MSRIEFANLVFLGGRFDGARMPVDTLSELAAYRVVVLSVAKAIYLAENPRRQRLPKGFEETFQLVLDRVDEGSLVPVVSRDVPNGVLSFFSGDGLFERARDLIESSIDSAARGTTLPSALPVDVLQRFAAFGRTLNEDERIVVAKPGTHEGATYDRRVRRKLVLLSQRSYEDDVDLVGEVREADKDTEGFALGIPGGQRVEVRPSPAFFPLATRAFAQKSALVRVRGVGLFDANGQLQRITNATDVSPAEEGEYVQELDGCPTSIKSQVDLLAALEDAWYDDTASKYDAAKLEWLSKLLSGVVDAFKLPMPYVYPSPDGRARAEWSGDHYEIIVNVDLVSRTAEIVSADVSTMSASEHTVTFGEPGAESAFGRLLRDYLIG